MDTPLRDLTVGDLIYYALSISAGLIWGLYALPFIVVGYWDWAIPGLALGGALFGIALLIRSKRSPK